MSRLREIDPEARILFCSGYTEDDVNSHLDASDSAVGFIHKPFRRIELLDWIDLLVATGKGQAA